MSAQILREAAALMRSRAEAANECGMVADCDDAAHVWYRYSELHERFSDCRRPHEDAEHIASWPPAVALAVADLLTGEAMAPSAWNVAALAVANAYLGRTS